MLVNKPPPPPPPKPKNRNFQTSGISKIGLTNTAEMKNKKKKTLTERLVVVDKLGETGRIR